MPNAFDPMSMKKARAVLDNEKRLKANASKLRFEYRQLRLDRRQLELKNKRAQQALDPIAKALAKAKALANHDSN